MADILLLFSSANWWQNVGADLVRVGGYPQASWPGAASVGGDSAGAGRTHILSNRTYAMRQDTYIRRFVAHVNQAGASSGWQFKLFRLNGANWDFVAESEVFTPAGTGAQTFTLATPMQAQMGDIAGVWLVGGAGANEAKVTSTASGTNNNYAAGNISATNAFASTEGQIINVEPQGRKPFLAVAGDSWAEGEHTANIWHGYNDGAVDAYTGTRTSEIPYQMQQLYMPGLEYQCFGVGGAKYDYTAANTAPAAINSGAKAILVISGGNDVITGRTWSQIEADLNTIYALLQPGQHLFISEVGPGPSGRYDAAERALLIQWNANFVTWASGKDASVIPIWTALAGGDDILDAEYSYLSSGHLTQPGIDLVAQLWFAGLEAHYA